MKWISVEDDLPECDVTVLVYYGEPDVAFELDYMDFDSDTGIEYWVNSGDGVTHWMQLPEPPEGE
jgi:hypothetical protein